jgi:DNA-directed RNA polymerase sigma subunit (sigma70/sigma32)
LVSFTEKILKEVFSILTRKYMNYDLYMKEIESIPLLTAEEEKALATKAFSGDKGKSRKN